METEWCDLKLYCIQDDIPYAVIEIILVKIYLVKLLEGKHCAL